MPPIKTIVPDAETLLALEIPEVALVLLQVLATNNSEGCSPMRPALMSNFFNSAVSPAFFDFYVEGVTGEILRIFQSFVKIGLALME